MPIHPTAIVDPTARIAGTAEIGPYCVIGADVEIGARTRLMAHVYLEGPTWIGEDNIFFPYTTVGVAPQDLKYKGERAETRIGNRNRIREFVTIHRGTEGGGLVTSHRRRQPADGLRPRGARRRIGNHVILANAVTLAGHVTVEDWADVGASTGVHQFCRIGRHAFIGGYSVITQDVLPFSTTVSKRENRSSAPTTSAWSGAVSRPRRIEALQTAFRLLTRAGLNTSQAIERIRAESAAVRRSGRAARIHRRLRARRHQVMRYGLIAGNGRFPLLALETRAEAGPRRGGHRHQGGGVTRDRSRWRRAATGSRSAQLSRLDRDSQEEGITEVMMCGPGEARQHFLVDPAGLAAGEAAGVAAVARTPTG